MLTMEIVSTKKYWHMIDDSVYDSVISESVMIGKRRMPYIILAYVCMTSKQVFVCYLTAYYMLQVMLEDQMSLFQL